MWWFVKCKPGWGGISLCISFSFSGWLSLRTFVYFHWPFVHLLSAMSIQVLSSFVNMDICWFILLLNSVPSLYFWYLLPLDAYMKSWQYLQYLEHRVLAPGGFCAGWMVAWGLVQTFHLSWDHVTLHLSTLVAAVEILVRGMDLERQLLNKRQGQWWFSPCPSPIHLEAHTESCPLQPSLRAILGCFVSWGLVEVRHL